MYSTLSSDVHGAPRAPEYIPEYVVVCGNFDKAMVRFYMH